MDRHTIESVTLHAHTNPGVRHRFPSPRRKSRLVGIITSLALLVLLGLVGPLHVAYAHASGSSWTLTGSLNVAHFSHTATLLLNGDVLVAGGCCDSSGNSLASAELYDPSTHELRNEVLEGR